MIFRPVMKLKVTIMGNDSPLYALQKALVVTRTPTLLDSVVELFYMGENTMSHFDARGRIIYETHHLLFPAITILAKAIPAMQQLHTVRLARMSVSKMELYSILSSPCLIHLIIDRAKIPKLNKVPPPRLRKLTLIVVASWKGVEPLIGQLATSLEYLELQQCNFLAPRPLLYPPFPRLRELRHHQWYLSTTFSDRSRLSELIQLGSQITHLHLSGSFEHIDRVAAFPGSLLHLSVEAWMLTEPYFGTCTFPGLLSLSVKQCVLYKGSLIGDDHIRRLPSLIRDCFPRISSLQLHIQWSFRNVALEIARFQRNVQALTLDIGTLEGLDYEEIEATVPDRHNEITTAYLSTEQAPLQSLRLDITQTYHELEQSVAPCTRWVENDTLPFVTGVGGPDLKSVDVSFIQLETNWVQERVLRRQWAKSIKGEWEMYRSL